LMCRKTWQRDCRRQGRSMHQVSHIGANRSEWHGPDLRRSIDFHAVLLAMAGHDLRQHLQIILSSYGWLSARATSDPERERIARGQNAVMQMADQLHQLFTALRIHQKASHIASVPVRLGPLFSGLGLDATRFAAERGVKLRVVPTRAVVASDPVLLGSIIGNLMRNAVKFTPSGGQVLLGCRRFGSVVRIEVHDTGIGIPAERLRNIFEAFHRLEPARSDGIGLGLFVVNRAAELLQHQIDVRSTVGRGSCFTISANASGQV
jgi:two-component system, OmpR family, phosphate regulon sensor histidine kinase PhoR